MRGSLKEAVWALALCALATVLLRGFPAIDLKASALFYAGSRGFWLAGNPTTQHIRSLGEAIPTLAVALLAGAAVLQLVSARWRRLVPPKAVLFLALTLGLGPGLTTNVLLKDHWGRPRPVEIAAFGGSAPYVKPWTMSDACPRNCSFVSGEASGAFWLMALAPLLPGVWGRAALAGGVLAGLIVGAARVSYGGHFVSDVIFAGFVTFAVIWTLHAWLYGWRPAWADDAALEARYARLGRMLRSLFGRRRAPVADELAS